jgi:hypothetical protein
MPVSEKTKDQFIIATVALLTIYFGYKLFLQTELPTQPPTTVNVVKEKKTEEIVKTTFTKASVATTPRTRTMSNPAPIATPNLDGKELEK